MLRMYSSTAEQICKIRWDFVAQIKPQLVLDYGSGCGFFKAYAPSNITIDTFDIMPIPQSGINHQYYDLVTLWDVLEHENWGNLERNFDIQMEKIFDITNYIALTVPILPEGQDFLNWKHRKPEEHKYYFSIDILNRFFSVRGFKLVNSGYPECVLRKDIYSAIYGKK